MRQNIKSLRVCVLPLGLFAAISGIHMAANAADIDWKPLITIADSKRDAQGNLLPLQSYDETIRRGMAFLLKDHLKWFKGAPATLLDEKGQTQMPWVYYSNLQQDGTPFPESVDRFVSYPAFHHALMIRTFIGYWRYAKDARAIAEAVKLADWNIAHSTSADWAYGSLPYSTCQEQKPGGFRDKTGLMPDKAAIMALAYLQLHEATHEAQFLKAAEAIGMTLSKRQRPNGTWPFRVDPKTEAVVEEYTSSVIYAVMLFEKLDKLNGNNSYRACRDRAWNWLLNGPIKTKEFRGFYEDIPASPDGRANYDCLDTIRYLLANRTDTNGYLEMAKDLNAWIEKTFMDKISGFEPAEGIREQLQCNVVMGIHSLNWASMLLELSKAAGEAIPDIKALIAIVQNGELPSHPVNREKISQCEAAIKAIEAATDHPELRSIKTIFCAPAASAATLNHLRCEYLVDPLGIDVVKPRLSWVMESSRRGERQTAYQVLVASTPELLSGNIGDLWDSGKVESDQSVQVEYAGKPLASRTPCHWKVRVWDKNGTPSAWSAPAMWSMGLLQAADWGAAAWIGPVTNKPGSKDLSPEVRKAGDGSKAVYLRREFAVAKGVRSATVTVCGLGLYELFLNGNKVGDRARAPALGNIQNDVHYNTYDVTDGLVASGNAIGVILGNGYPVKFAGQIGEPGYPRLLLNLHLEYSDGTSGDVNSDGSWTLTSDGPQRENDEYGGEVYDARKEMPGWNKTGFDDSAWRVADVAPAPAGKLSAQKIEPMRRLEVLPALKVTNPAKGVYVVDFGQAHYGTTRLMNLPANAAGTKIAMVAGYRLDASGRLFTVDAWGAGQTDVYYTGGRSGESWSAIFRGQGHRYIEVTGFPGEPTVSNFECHVINNDLETTGEFSCSNPLINRIYEKSRWGLRAYKRDYPMDVDRYERLPWSGDPAKDAPGEHYMYFARSFYANWINEFLHDQAPNGDLSDVSPHVGWMFNNYINVPWESVVTIIPDDLYNFYEDLDTIRHCYGGMRKWMERVKSVQERDKTLGWDHCVFGDWCDVFQMDIPEADISDVTDHGLMATAYYYNNCQIMARFARLLGNAADAVYFAGQAAEVKAGFNERYFDAGRNRYSKGRADKNATQTSYILPLAFGLVPEANRAKVIDNLVNDILEENGGHLTVGLIGAQWLMQTLTQVGRPDVAYTVASRVCRPSLGYMVSTSSESVWERWDADTKPGRYPGSHLMNILVGDASTWFYATVGGINCDPDRPGFRQVIFRPAPVGDLTWAKARYHSIRGKIASEWSVTNRTFTWSVTIPANASGRVCFPAPYTADIREAGVPLSKVEGVVRVGVEDGAEVYSVPAGSYTFTAAAVDGYDPPPVNLALAGTARASSTAASYSPAKINDGDQAPFPNPTIPVTETPSCNSAPPNCSWMNAAGVALPQWVQVDFGAERTFNRIELWTTRGCPVKDYQLQYWNGSAWVDTVPAITGNTQIHRTHRFSNVTGSKLRVLCNAGPDSQPASVCVNELEVFNDGK